MKKTILLLSIIFLFFIILLCNAQGLKIKYPLTDEDIDEAIKAGFEHGGRGLYLKDEWKFLSSTGNKGFSIWMVTPRARICNAAYDAKRRYIEFTREDVYEDKEFLEPVILILAYPDTPVRPVREDLRRAQNVEHVVIADTKRELIIQPVSFEPFYHEETYEDGTVLNYKGASVKFAIEDVIKVSENDFKKKGEFYVKVIGPRSEKEFKIKDKHLKHLE